MTWCAAARASLCGASFVAAAAVTPSAADADEVGDRPVVVFESEFMSDYIYRGVSLSERKPSAAASIDAQWHGLYVATNVQSVNLPTDPAAEVTLWGGYRRTVAGFDLDLGAYYFYYPGEITTDAGSKTSYWEYALSAERDLTDFLSVNGMTGYAPNVSGTGAWGTYVEAGLEIDLPPFMRDVAWEVDASAGYWRFGNTSAAQGGFPLPAYVNWHVGLAFTVRQHLTLDLSYWDTNLSKEECFVFTGDTMASPGGAVDPIRNPGGLRSRLCGAALVGTLSFKFGALDLKD